MCLKFRQFRIGVFFLFGSFLAEESVAEISRISQALSNSSIFQLAREKFLEKKRKDLEDHQDLRVHKKEDHQDLRSHEKEDHQDLRSHTNGKIPKIARSPRSRRRPCFFSSNTSKSPFCALLVCIVFFFLELAFFYSEEIAHSPEGLQSALRRARPQERKSVRTAQGQFASCQNFAEVVRTRSDQLC